LWLSSNTVSVASLVGAVLITFETPEPGISSWARKWRLKLS
jgi:hypothetical protein